MYVQYLSNYDFGSVKNQFVQFLSKYCPCLKIVQFFQTSGYFLIIFLSSAGLLQVSSTFWTVTHSLPGGERAIIPHFNQDIQCFHMTPITQIFISEKALF